MLLQYILICVFEIAFVTILLFFLDADEGILSGMLDDVLIEFMSHGFVISLPEKLDLNRHC